MSNSANLFLEQLRLALEGGASEATRQQATEACWALLAALDAVPMPVSSPAAPPEPARAPEVAMLPPQLPPVAAILASPDPLGSLLDAVIAKYRGVLPDKMPRRPTLNIPLVDFKQG